MAALTFSHIGITVPDLEKAVEFYSKAFGLYVLMEQIRRGEHRVDIEGMDIDTTEPPEDDR